MTWVLPRYPRIFLASALGLAAIGSAPALSKVPPQSFGAIKGESTQKDHKDMSAAMSAHCDTMHAQPMNGVASDPEEGGQVSARKTTVSDMHVTKHVDKASSKMMESNASGSSC